MEGFRQSVAPAAAIQAGGTLDSPASLMSGDEFPATSILRWPKKSLTFSLPSACLAGMDVRASELFTGHGSVRRALSEPP